MWQVWRFKTPKVSFGYYITYTWCKATGYALITGHGRCPYGKEDIDWIPKMWTTGAAFYNNHIYQGMNTFEGCKQLCAINDYCYFFSLNGATSKTGLKQCWFLMTNNSNVCTYEIHGFDKSKPVPGTECSPTKWPCQTGYKVCKSLGCSLRGIQYKYCTNHRNATDAVSRPCVD